jgi:hypothetical protein
MLDFNHIGTLEELREILSESYNNSEEQYVDCFHPEEECDCMRIAFERGCACVIHRENCKCNICSITNKLGQRGGSVLIEIDGCHCGDAWCHGCPDDEEFERERDVEHKIK